MRAIEDSAHRLAHDPPDLQPPLPRDPTTGFGLLDVRSALALGDSGLLPVDNREPDDTPATATLVPRSVHVERGTVDYGDDPVDAYAIHLARGQVLSLGLDATTPQAGNLDLLLWRPGTTDLQLGSGRRLAAFSSSATAHERISSFVAPVAGTYFAEVFAGPPASGGYRLSVRRGPAPPVTAAHFGHRA
jgi:hypothetical protein